MESLMPIHYAVSDAAIVLVALFAGVALWRHGLVLHAFAMACFGVAAAIGVVRIAGGLQVELAALHAGASQLLGLAGAIALAAASLRRTSRMREAGLFGAMLIMAAAIFFLAKPLLAPLFVIALVVGGGSAFWRVRQHQTSWLVPASFALMIANALVIRRAPWLDPAAGWHAYHLLIALGLAALAFGIVSQPKSR